MNYLGSFGHEFVLCRPLVAVLQELTLKIQFVLEVLLQGLLAVVILTVFRRHLGLRLGGSRGLVLPEGLGRGPACYRGRGFGFLLEIHL